MEKLSQLIRRGAAMVDGQCRNDYIRRYKDKTKCCVVGAAYLAFTGKLPRHSGTYKPKEESPQEVLMAAGYRVFDYDNDIDVVEWNDSEQMSFEEIAQRLEAKGL